MSSSATGDPAEKKDQDTGHFLRIPVAIWIALIGLATTTISGFVGHSLRFDQTPVLPTPTTPAQPTPTKTVTVHDESPGNPDMPRPDALPTDIAVAMNLVRGEIDKPKIDNGGKTIHCSGKVTNYRPDMHLWLAVEVDGFSWFKDSEIEPDVKRGEWKKDIEEYGNSPVISICLYIADNAANEEIKT